MTHWNNKTVIITGGGSGIGKSTAAKFLKKGATVYINGRTEVKLKEACEGLRIISEKIDFIPGDVSKVSDCERIVKEYPQKTHARFTTPEEVAESIYFLSKPEVEAITGACLPIDFGLTAGY